MEKTKRVLVVTGEQGVLESINDVLSPDYEIIAAWGALQAGDLLLSHQFDFLIISLELPVLDGAELIRIIRTDAAFKEIPILALSPYGGEAAGGKLDVQAVVSAPSISGLPHGVEQIVQKTEANSSGSASLKCAPTAVAARTTESRAEDPCLLLVRSCGTRILTH